MTPHTKITLLLMGTMLDTPQPKVIADQDGWDRSKGKKQRNKSQAPFRRGGRG